MGTKVLILLRFDENVMADRPGMDSGKSFLIFRYG
jgi:hypothetical protein